MTITEDQLERWIRELIREGRLDRFYKWHEWRELSDNIKRENNNECQLCKQRGKHRAARTVHHVKHVREFPRLAMSRTYTDENGKEQKQLIPLCEPCHNEQHPEKGRAIKGSNGKHFTNEEKW